MRIVTLDNDNWLEGPGYRKQRLLDAAALACHGALVQIVEMAPQNIIPDHVHTTSREFYYSLQGTCTLFVNDEAHRLQAGDMFLVEPGDVHRLRNDGDAPFRLLVFKTNATVGDTQWLNSKEQ
jgi:quercetin dioxygenase-like cupin family protein